MEALLGKITGIKRKAGASANRLEVSFKAACTMPKRGQTPEWLKDQTLKIEREVADPREVGNPGDSIVLTPAESARWLYPLTVSPNISYGALPKALRIDLRWWKDDKGPEYTVRANGRQVTGKFRKRKDGFSAKVDVRQFFDSEPRLPVAFEVACDKMKATSTVLPEDEPFCAKLVPPEGEFHRIENAWYAVDINAKCHAGGIASLKEKGRGVDHFRTPEDMIQHPFELAGHTDRLRRGWDWWNKPEDAEMTCSGAQHDGGAVHLHLDGVIDEGQGARTSVAYALHDDIPLVSWRRDYRFHPVKKKDEDKGKEKPKEPIDDLNAMGPGLRAAWMADHDGGSGSRVLCADGERLVVIRCAQRGEFIYPRNWRMSQGWAVVEHPLRSEYAMYLFDKRRPPHPAIELGAHSIVLNVMWPRATVKPGDSIGHTLGLCAGELCGASADGAWVACRTAVPDGGVRCAVIARTNQDAANSQVTFKLGSKTRKASLERVVVSGVGDILYATAEFPSGRMEDQFKVTAAGIADRREQ